MASSKTKSVDSDITEHFFYRIDLSIDPPLPDSKAKVQNDYFGLKQVKDEDVVFDPIEGIKVVTNNVTSFDSSRKPDEHTYGYPDFKKAIQAVIKIAKDAGSDVNGQVVVRNGANGRFYRLKVDSCTLTVDAANLGWSDGTQTPYPEGDGA